jgi:hypothetical protein
VILAALPLADTALQLEIGIPLLAVVGIVNLAMARYRRNRR